MLRDRLLESLESEEDDRRRAASSWRAAGSAPARSPPGSAEHAAPAASRPHRRRRPGHLAGRHRRGLVGRAGRRRTARAAWVDAAELTPDDDAALAAWLADPTRAQGAPRRQGPDARARGARLAARRAGQRHRARGLPRPARPALLRPGRPDPALPQARAAAGAPATTARASSASTRSTAPAAGAAETAMLHARAVLDLADALDEAIERARRHPAARRGRAAAGRPARAMEQTGIAVDLDHLESLESHFARRGEAGRRGGVRGDRQGDQPRLAQAAPGGALRRARHAQDQAHQDRLHDRRRRAAGALRQDRAPVPAAPAAAPRREPAAADHRGAAQDGRRRRPDPHHVQPDDRGHRPALQHRPQPAEHPDPHRGGPPDPRGLRGRRGLRVPDDRRLQPDRDADHGPPVRGRAADRGVQVRPRLPLDHRRPGLRRPGRRRDRRDAGQDQGDELRPRLRPVGVRPRPAAAASSPARRAG